MIVSDGYWITSTTSVEELHKFAEQNKIGRHWFHGKREGRPRYKLPYRKLGLAKKCEQVTGKDVLAYAKAVGLAEQAGKEVKSPFRNHRYNLGQHVFARLDYEEGDDTWLHCIVVGRSGRANNPTYTVTSYERDRVVYHFSQKLMKKM